MFTVDNIQKLGFDLTPIICVHCHSDEVSYNQQIKDAYCANCGQWQSDDVENEPQEVDSTLV